MYYHYNIIYYTVLGKNYISYYFLHNSGKGHMTQGRIGDHWEMTIQLIQHHKEMEYDPMVHEQNDIILSENSAELFQ